ncbi:MAG: hypothetical protein IIB25_05625 [Chloroflexi bacterium]|nr:hypothetical protein [Chloroflexota bacterium]
MQSPAGRIFRLYFECALFLLAIDTRTRGMMMPAPDHFNDFHEFEK